jgi:hypothetical protein
MDFQILVEQVGLKGAPRWLIRDSFNRFFTGSEWTEDPTQGLLFDDLAEVFKKRDRLRRLIRPRTFEAIVRMTVNHDCYLELEELREYLKRHSMFFVCHPPAGTPEHCCADIDWETLRQTN